MNINFEHFSDLKVVNDNILFVWIDKHEMETVTEGGIILQRTLSRDRNRWGQIVAVGPLSSARVGEYVLPYDAVEPYGCNYNGYEIWRTTDEHVLAVTEDINVALPLND